MSSYRPVLRRLNVDLTSSATDHPSSDRATRRLIGPSAPQGFSQDANSSLMSKPLLSRQDHSCIDFADAIPAAFF